MNAINPYKVANGSCKMLDQKSARFVRRSVFKERFSPINAYSNGLQSYRSAFISGNSIQANLFKNKHTHFKTKLIKTKTASH